ncbi:MDR family MFS transporter [Georgenia deserti]|uniref:MDR family MFS transporter n=1 Tax=Georgenia deserti TaxID=2093781 RepID=A0ABW4L9T3_9MICO
MTRPRKELTDRRAYAGMTPEQAEAAHHEHRQILKVLTGLLLAMFVGSLSATIVGNALPVIVGEIGGSQQQYTWIVTASILASTAATPIFGKLADLFDKKTLLLVAISIFGVGSLVAGFSVSAEMLIAVRVLQGIGMGSIMVLVQTTIATIIPPRQRGRYNGYLGAVIAASTVSGPLIGGVIVDIPWLGWRWCFWISVPFMIAALVVLVRNLHVPTVRRAETRIDWAGAFLISAATTTLLIWISFADHSFAWVSWQTAAMLGGAAVLGVAFVLVERKVREPVVPLYILTERSTVLAIVASLAIGTTMFGANIYLGQYFQIGRSYSPTISGWLTLPLMLGLLISSTVSGRLVTRTGRWKPYVTGGMILLAVGIGLLSTVRADTALWVIGAFLLIAGFGLGASMQNLVLAVQNSNALSNVGAATSTVTFFRNLGGAMGIQILAAVYTHRVTDLTVDGLRAQGAAPGAFDASSESLDLTRLPDAVVQVIRNAYGDGIGVVFLVAAVAAVLGVLAVAFMRATMLRSTWDTPPSRASEASAAGETDRTTDGVLDTGLDTAPGDATPATTAMVDRDAVPGSQEPGETAGPGADAVEPDTARRR